ncbi:thiamine-phosphate kinase [Candidatus Pelagibacter sp.]|uniref:thiamine-phosphate kinase n=1 Tax=Candidatus Pelagibacter sp. TaxID=2024849 RepID=UPI003F877B78
MHEFDLINNYFLKIVKKNKSALNLNDDVFFDKKRGVVISVDTYNIGTHFYDFKSPDLVIKKILRSSISDLICKGVKPKFYFISGSGNKKTFTKNNLYKISKSLKSEQNKFNIDLCGGDTTFSNKLSFTITSLGYSNKIIYRNNAKLNDDIYVTGNLGDSYLGFKSLSDKVKLKNKEKSFFVDKYYKPELPLNLTKYLFKFANSSIDVSDGLIDDLAKMINRQRLSFHLFENKIPVSKKLSKLIKKQRLNKINLISNGDDYQVLFTADIRKARIIQNVSKSTGIKITKIGKIVSGKDRSLIFNEKGKQIQAKSKGYIHQF